jgi:hypothetical protein
MKLTFATLAVASLLLVNTLELVQAKGRVLMSGDVEGELSVKDGCKLTCEWKAKETRRLGHTNNDEITYVNVEHRKLAVILKDVECTIEIGEDEFEKKIEFPTGWVLKKKEADDTPTYWSFTTSFTVRWFMYSPYFCFGYRPSHFPRLMFFSLNL